LASSSCNDRSVSYETTMTVTNDESDQDQPR
jgi:hypothetical protein